MSRGYHVIEFDIVAVEIVTPEDLAEPSSRLFRDYCSRLPGESEARLSFLLRLPLHDSQRS